MSKNIKIAAIGYIAMAILSELVGDEVIAEEFELLPEPQQAALLAGVEMLAADPEAGPDARHNAWMAQMLDEGWVKGAKKDDDAKTHPRLVPFEQLPKKEQAKERMLHAIVRRMTYADPYAEEEVVAAPAAPAAPAVKANLVQVKYIGKKPEHKDNLYGTGLVFGPGEVHYVSSAVAKKMLDHTDTYQQDGVVAEVEVQTSKEEVAPEGKTSLPLPNIGSMTRAEMELYAQQHFNEKFGDDVSDADMGGRILAMIQQRGQ